jgi:hypothetical protein
MEKRYVQTTHQAVENHHVTLLELLDRIVDKGVMVKGEILLSVAEVDLIYLNLGLLLSSVKTVVHAARADYPQQGKRTSYQEAFLSEQYQDSGSQNQSFSPLPQKQSLNRHGQDNKPPIPSTRKAQRTRRHGQKANIDQDNVEKGLVKLVLTLVDLIRQLMEKQAIRRIEDEQLEESEIERVGNAFFLLDEKIEQLKKAFDLTDEDLNLDLGPLGDLL